MIACKEGTGQGLDRWVAGACLGLTWVCSLAIDFICQKRESKGGFFRRRSEKQRPQQTGSYSTVSIPGARIPPSDRIHNSESSSFAASARPVRSMHCDVTPTKA